MDNFKALGDTPPPNVVEEDPAAEFLAAEQNQLAQLEGDDFDFDQAAGLQNGDTNPEVKKDKMSEGQNQPASYSPQSTLPKIEPEPIRKWREDQAVMLKEKDAASEEKAAEWRQQACQELDDWYRHREEQLQKTKETNRESEAAYMSDRDRPQPGHEWEKVTSYCEFNPKSAPRSSKDLSRMRGILLQLKQNPIEIRQ
ncbi:DgyrCDS9733 [Dimorphilus gyrociliatus]|uniref:Clathrin light chain n=1 Tax=Dimorphilus gyrociliatus TaxID=2664684 RepID=A0A7I8VZI0_9ANNE|nr:DgyrCDS9733 [Dimorphilus gyrociliatus]